MTLWPKLTHSYLTLDPQFFDTEVERYKGADKIFIIILIKIGNKLEKINNATTLLPLWPNTSNYKSMWSSSFTVFCLKWVTFGMFEGMAVRSNAIWSLKGRCHDLALGQGEIKQEWFIATNKRKTKEWTLFWGVGVWVCVCVFWCTVGTLRGKK